MLYIPLWLYLNSETQEEFIVNNCFTFHSGYILIVVIRCFDMADYYFTFHSGYILIDYPDIEAVFVITYTFHSGYILKIDNVMEMQGRYIFT